MHLSDTQNAFSTLHKLHSLKTVREGNVASAELRFNDNAAAVCVCMGVCANVKMLPVH